jgi:Transcriptional regulators
MLREDEELIEIFTRIFYKFSNVMKSARSFGTNFILYPSEIHVIDVIGREPGINVTGIADKLGITKGAIPKIIRKLIRKELIYRYQEAANKKMVCFHLTDKGAVAFQKHIEFHRNLDDGIFGRLKALNQEERALLKDIFAEIEKFADSRNAEQEKKRN